MEYQVDTKFILQELTELLKTSDELITITAKLISGNEYSVFIKLDKSLIKHKEDFELKAKIEFVLVINNNHPIVPPNLFCLTKFSDPEISDPRDILEDVTGVPWKKEKYTIKGIINKLPEFVNRILSTTENDEIGKFYLDYIYDINILKLFPALYFDDIREEVFLSNNKKTYDDPRKIMITEGYLLLFKEKSVFESEKLRLLFWGSMKSLKQIKQITNGDAIELTWMVRKNKTSVMKLKTLDGDQILDRMVENLSKIKIKYKISNETNGPKNGELPDVNIHEVEQEISKLEIKMKINRKNDKSIEVTQELMNYYEKAVQYYSAINDYRYQIYMKKIQNLFGKIGGKGHHYLNRSKDNNSNKDYKERIKEKIKTKSLKKKNEENYKKLEVNSNNNYNDEIKNEENENKENKGDDVKENKENNDKENEKIVDNEAVKEEEIINIDKINHNNNKGIIKDNFINVHNEEKKDEKENIIHNINENKNEEIKVQNENLPDNKDNKKEEEMSEEKKEIKEENKENKDKKEEKTEIKTENEEKKENKENKENKKNKENKEENISKTEETKIDTVLKEEEKKEENKENKNQKIKPEEEKIEEKKEENKSTADDKIIVFEKTQEKNNSQQEGETAVTTIIKKSDLNLDLDDDDDD